MTKTDLTPENLAAVAVAVTHEPFLRSLADAWLSEEGDNPENRTKVREQFSFIWEQPDLMEFTIWRQVRELSWIGRLRFAVARRRALREAERLA